LITARQCRCTSRLQALCSSGVPPCSAKAAVEKESDDRASARRNLRIGFLHSESRFGLGRMSPRTASGGVRQKHWQMRLNLRRPEALSRRLLSVADYPQPTAEASRRDGACPEIGTVRRDLQAASLRHGQKENRQDAGRWQEQHGGDRVVVRKLAGPGLRARVRDWPRCKTLHAAPTSSPRVLTPRRDGKLQPERRVSPSKWRSRRVLKCTDK